MGRRVQPRVKGILPVRISGTDGDGKPFAEHVCTLNISNKGASLTGVRAPLSPGDTIGLQYRNRQARFQVAWVIPNQAQGSNVGLQCLQPEKELWPVDTPAEGDDHYVPAETRLRKEHQPRGERRGQTRYAISGTAYVQTMNGSGGRWTRLEDLSLTGCHLQTLEPMEVGRNLSLKIKVADYEFEATATVRSSCPGIAMGVEFTFLSNADRSTLRNVLARVKELDAVTQ